MSNWLKEAGKPFAGQTVRLATESTPPSNAINSALKGYFTEMTGINVEIETLPLEQANEALARLRDGRLTGAAVLVME